MQKKEITIEKSFYEKIRQALQVRKLITITLSQKVKAIVEKKECVIEKDRPCRIFSSGEKIIVSAPKIGEFWLKEGEIILFKKISQKNVRKVMKVILEKIDRMN